MGSSKKRKWRKGMENYLYHEEPESMPEDIKKQKEFKKEHESMISWSRLMIGIGLVAGIFSGAIGFLIIGYVMWKVFGYIFGGDSNESERPSDG